MNSKLCFYVDQEHFEIFNMNTINAQQLLIFYSESNVVFLMALIKTDFFIHCNRRDTLIYYAAYIPLGNKTSQPQCHKGKYSFCCYHHCSTHVNQIWAGSCVMWSHLPTSGNKREHITTGEHIRRVHIWTST